MSLQQELPYLTTKIHVKVSEDKFLIGTGFFFHLDVIWNDVNFQKLMLISNKHVILGSEDMSELDRELTVFLNRKKDNEIPDLGNIEGFVIEDFRYRYYPHPDSDIDLACLDVTDFLNENVHFRCLDKRNLEPIDYGTIALGSDVMFAGYPENRYDTVNNLPLIRTGTIASMPDVDFNGRGEVVIDAQVFKGQSGSPVFVKSGHDALLLGVICQTMVKNSQLQILPANMSGVGIEQILGLGIVIKQRHVIELIDYAAGEIRQLIGK